MKKFYIMRIHYLNRTVLLVFSILSCSLTCFSQEKLSKTSEVTTEFAAPEVYSQPVTNKQTPITYSVQINSDLPKFIQQFSTDTSPLSEEEHFVSQKKNSTNFKAVQGALPVEESGLKSAGIMTTAFCDDMPIGTNDEYAIGNDNILSVAAPGFLMNDIDLDGEALTATAILNTPNHGNITAFPDGSFTYEPDEDFIGLDTFVYRMMDTSLNASDSVYVIIKVLPQSNRNPVGNNDRFAALSGTILSIAAPGFLANDIDPDGEVISATAILDTPNHGNITAFPDGSFTYEPDEDFIGLDTFAYRMRDASLNVSDSVKVVLDVIEGNRAPVGVDDKFSVVINTTLAVAAPGFLANDFDLDGDALTATSILNTPNHGNITAFPDGSFTYEPDADFIGLDTFVYRMRDAALNASDSVTVTFEVYPGGTLPVGTNDQYLTANDKVLTVAAPGILMNDIDLDGEAISATAILDTPNHGNITAFPDGSFTYEPDADFIGIDTFVYRMRDASLNTSDSVYVIITVLPQSNRNPVGVNDRFTALGKAVLSIAAPGFLANDIDPDGEVISATAILDTPNHGNITAFPDGSFTYEPNADFIGLDTFVYRMRDAALNVSDSVKVVIEVIEGNRAPIGTDDKFTAVINTTLAIAAPGFLANDIDLDGDALSATAILDTPNHGNITAFPDGSFTYEPDADFVGLDTFVYRMRDAALNASDSVLVIIDVAAPNQPPVAIANDIQTECTGPSGTTVTLDASNSSDPENGPLIYTWFENSLVIAGPTDLPTADVVLSTGVHNISLMVEDLCGTTSSDNATVTVEDTSAPLVDAAFLETAHPHEFEISCSSEDVCSEIVSSTSVILIPELISPSVQLRNNKNYSLEIDVEKNSVKVKAPDAAAFWASIVASGGIMVSDGQVISAKSDKNKYEYKFDSAGNLISVAGDMVTLKCTATDSKGNMGVGEATIPSNKLKSDEIEIADLHGEDFTGLHRNYPNPFKQYTRIEFKLERSAFVNVIVFDQAGRMVEQLVSKQMPEGLHQITWDAKQNNPGIYYYRIENDGNQLSGKMIHQR